MSELKAYRFLGQDEVWPDANFGSDYYLKCSDYYLKSEADKVIADLEESHKKEVEQLLMEIVELKADYKEACDRLQTANLIKDEQLTATRHQKYKRCLNKAEWCYSMSVTMYVKRDTDPVRECKYWYHNRGIWLEKWKRKWLELAKKFKEAK